MQLDIEAPPEYPRPSSAPVITDELKTWSRSVIDQVVRLFVFFLPPLNGHVIGFLTRRFKFHLRWHERRQRRQREELAAVPE